MSLRTLDDDLDQFLASLAYYKVTIIFTQFKMMIILISLLLIYYPFMIMIYLGKESSKDEAEIW